jgi:hypothetical protein
MAPLCCEETVPVQDVASLTSPVLQSIAHAPGHQSCDVIGNNSIYDIHIYIYVCRFLINQTMSIWALVFPSNYILCMVPPEETIAKGWTSLPGNYLQNIIYHHNLDRI